MRWTVTQVADAVAGKRGSGLDALARVAGVSIDSRTIRPGELFIAIHGPSHDGHDYVADVFEKGAVAAVVAEPLVSRYPGWMQDRCVTVPDTLHALHSLARAVRKEWGKKICGITGSVGKTTTKEILAALLGTKLRVLKSEGNFNNEYGLPLTIFRLEPEHDVAVLEMGMSFPGELKRLAAIALPNVAIETRVTAAHLLNFSSVDEIALAKRELIEGLWGPSSLAVLNADDARVAAMAAVAPGRVVFYGVEKPAEFQAEEIEDRGALGSSFTLVHRGKRTRMELALPGRHVVGNALAALAAASEWDIGVADAAKVFRELRTPAMRGELIRFTSGFALINDSYNSSPAALQAMMNLLAATPGFERRILAAGEMRELGPSSAKLHREGGEFAAKTGKMDFVIAVQGDAKEIIEGAVAAGVPRERTRFFATPTEAAAFLVDFVRPGDLLLVKGSRSVRMERVVEAMLGRFAPVDAPSGAGAGH
ncbi:MAG TPA: UDP-N-acetylmuramoyl-tripeptide--D-alanyl-D-alanine ligase [Candidatus Saccharimonadales bacterium]|nr:UDP-N-acetylmuramoyl-tripeptide--D-alanyl-D-alanine ligase [Candidatus Saccharimonadales bacterium]